MPIYLYLKTHNVTGLKYLGKTQQNPFEYKGSGKYWRQHLRVYGDDVKTEILKECADDAEVKQLGEHYSRLWNIVENPEFANLAPETGEGGPMGQGWHPSEEQKLKAIRYGESNGMYGRSRKGELTGEKNGMFGKTHGEETKKIMREKRKGRKPALGMKHSEEHKALMSARVKRLKWWTNGKVRVRAETSPGPEWKNGRKIHEVKL